MPDRLALARRAYIDTAAAANAVFAADLAAARGLLDGEMDLARRSRTRIDKATIAAWREAGAGAATRLEAAVGPARAEVDAAIAEARSNGTFHRDATPAETLSEQEPAHA